MTPQNVLIGVLLVLVIWQWWMHQRTLRTMAEAMRAIRHASAARDREYDRLLTESYRLARIVDRERQRVIDAWSIRRREDHGPS